MKQVLTINDFKGFETQHVSLRNLTILAGSNSVGKSSVIQALLLTRSTYDNNRCFGTKDEIANLQDQARKWLNYIIPGANFDNAIPLGKSKVIQGTFGESLPTNVGFGISYCLPIIVNGLLAEKNTVFIVENPEAHLHPTGQSRIGRFLAQIASTGVQVIVETHSEHIINGVKIAILEGDKLNKDDAIVNFIYKDENEKSVIKEIYFNEEAEFDKFPPGFIDQEQRDIAEMVRLIKKRKNAS